jgi:multiple sugar transport system ATP-binding protein
MNTLPVTPNGSVRVAGADVVAADGLRGEHATVGFRPEAVVVDAEGPIPARIRTVEDLGPEVFVHLVIDHDGEEHRIVAKAAAPFAGASGDNVRLALRGTIHLFDAAEVRRASVSL